MRVNKCDICGATDDKATLIKVKCKSTLFATSMFSPPPFSDVRRFDICEECVQQFKKFVEYKNEERSYDRKIQKKDESNDQ